VARRLLIAGGVVAALLLGGAGLIRLAGAGATEFAVEGEVLRISGPVTGAATDRFERLLEQNPQLETVVLGDMPGTDDVGWLVSIGYLLRGAGLDTRVEGKVYNDAILIFAAGVRREIAGGSLSLVPPAVAAERGWPFDRRPVAQAERRAYLGAMLPEADAAGFFEAALAGTEVRQLSGAEAAGLGLIDAAASAGSDASNSGSD
jgi:hypothetical protein